MRLLDLVAQYRKPLIIETGSHPRPIVLSGARDFARRVAECPLRFVLADSLTRASAELAFSEGDRLAGCLDLLRMPARLLWIEWSDAIHQEVISECSIITRKDVLALGRQVGLLLQAGPSGRSAQARTFWNIRNSAGEADVVMSPLETHINLEECFAPDVRAEAMLRGEFGGICCEEPGVAELLERVRFRFDDAWSTYYRECALDAASRDEIVQKSLAAVAHDIPLVLAFFLLLSAKGATQPVPIDRRQLNRKRAGKGRPALLDHVEVHATLPGHSTRPGADDSQPATRRPPRLHGVRGHLVRREDRVFWRTPHLRGSARQGIVRSRTVCLSFSRAG